MASEVVAPMTDNNEKGVVNATTTKIRRSERLKNIQATNPTTVAHLPLVKQRIKRPVDPVERRKKAWPFKWEGWRINAVAFQFRRSGHEAMQKLRDGQDDLWKTNPQDASLYEDALAVFDDEATARDIQQRFLLPEEIETTPGEVTEEDEAAMALLDLGNSNHANTYVQDEVVHNTLRLRPVNPKRVAETNLPRLKELDEVVQETRNASTTDAHVAPQREIEVTTAGNDSNTVPTAKTTDHDSRTTKVPNNIAPKTTADNEAALDLLSLAYSGTPQNYVEDDMPDNTRALRPFESSSQGPQKVDTEHEGDMTTPAPKKTRAAQETPDKPSTSTPVKSRLLRYEDNDDNEDTQTSPVKTVPKKTKTKKTATNAQPQLNPPAAGLPLGAPANTAGIPNDALALNEHFKKNHPCTLGVQLPVNRARTRWDWTDYVTRKLAMLSLTGATICMSGTSTAGASSVFVVA